MLGLSPAKFLQFDNAMILSMSGFCVLIVAYHIFDLMRAGGGVRALYDHVKSKWLRVRSTTGGEFALGFLTLCAGIFQRAVWIWHWRKFKGAPFDFFPYAGCIIADFFIIWGFMCIIRCIVRSRAPDIWVRIFGMNDKIWPWAVCLSCFTVSLLFAISTL